MIVLPMSVVISKPLEDILLTMDFFIFSIIVLKDCVITAKPSSLYRVIFDGPIIGNISISLTL